MSAEILNFQGAKPISGMGSLSKIFSLNGGIFDRFYSQNNDSYEIGSHTIAYVKNAFYNILCNTAVYMFEHFSDNSIPYDVYIKIIENEKSKAKEIFAKSSEKNSPLWYDFPIDNLYEKCDTISFVHKTFYEYFTAEYFFTKIYLMSKDIIKRKLYADENDEEYTKIISELSNLFSQNAFSTEIVDYLQYKINVKFSDDEVEILRDFYTYIFKKMLEKGMTYKLSINIKYTTLQAECVIFANILDFLHLWIKNKLCIKLNTSEIDQISIYLYLWSLMNIPTNSNEYKMLDYISDKHPHLCSRNFKIYKRLNLSNLFLDTINLENINLGNINFNYSSMANCFLKGASLVNSNFKCTILIDSSLEGADLSSSFFRETILSYSNISNANFGYSSVPDADFTGCSAKNAIFINVSGLDEAIYTHELDDAIFD